MATVPLSRAASRMLHSYSGAKMAQTISQEQTLDPQYLSIVVRKGANVGVCEKPSSDGNL
eukprot:m.164776 g.164776  ORF g.164776 m.164776 type:complete len:60 (-) comp15246_c0_seq1:38-217(-)